MDVLEKFIDIKEVIRAKNPRLLKMMPPFAIGFMKRLIHQDEVNRIIYTYRDLYGIDFVHAVLNDMGVTYSVEGLEQVPREGRYIFAANHPLGGFDGLVLMAAIGKTFPEIRFVVNDILLHLKNFEPVFVPVNKHGRQTSDYARRIDDAYTGATQVLNFPAGLCSRKIDGAIADLPWHNNFIRKAIHYRRDVVPVYFDGRNSNFFYNLAKLRKALHIKANIEMAFLVDEFFKQKGNHVRLCFGQPVPYASFDNTRTATEWAAVIRGLVYAMR